MRWVPAIGFLALALTFPSDGLDAQTRCVEQKSPIHERLAALDAGTVCPRVVLINRFRVLLLRIAGECRHPGWPPNVWGIPTNEVADQVVTARRLLFDEGIEVGYLEITEYLDRATRDKGPIDCARLLTLYVLVRSE